MIENAQYRARCEAREEALASHLADEAAGERHLALADHQADTASLIREPQLGAPASLSGKKLAPRSSNDGGLSQAISRSRELLAQSRRILAESREHLPPRS